MRKLAMAMAVCALAMFAQGARAEDAAKERREAADATADQMKQGAHDAKTDVKHGAQDTRDAAKTQADKAGDKMSDTRSDMKRDANDRMAQANDKKHSLFDGKDNFKVDGKIEKVSKDSLTISRSDLPPAKLRISKETKVELDGDAVSAGQLKQGQDVKASFNLREDKPEAVEIKAKKADEQKK